MVSGGGFSFLNTETSSGLRQFASNLHQDTLFETYSGFLISSQQGPLIFFSSKNVSKELVLEPNMWLKVK